MTRRRHFTGEGAAYYHLASHLRAGLTPFTSEEKIEFENILEQVADFSGINVVTHAILDEDFHLLVEVPPIDQDLSDEVILKRFTQLYPHPTPWNPVRPDELAEYLKNGSAEGISIREKLLRRMNNQSWFMKMLKQRFSLWVNRSREQFGAIWSDRYESLMVQGDPWPLQVVAAYIDLSPVRAGIVDDPADYPFCGYGKAVAGNERALDGLSRMGDDLDQYEELLRGPEIEDSSDELIMDHETLVELLANEEVQMPLHAVLRCHIRYFSDGFILGYPDFVDEQLRGDSAGRVRKRKPHPMRGAPWRGLAVGTGLRKALFQ
tara:strand:- start:40287 stop:41246 length:960 start_codon:yes stop_codon:yes gene_type:complete